MPPVSDSDHRRLEAVVYPDCIVESHQISDASRGWRRVGVTKVWRTERLLGRGGFGEVHLQSQESDKDVKRALKIIPTRGVKLSLADCQRELTAMIEFTKPKYRDAAVFVDFIGWFQNDDAMFLAMEYMPLGDLEQNMKEIEKSAINTESALPEEEVQEIIRQILEGLKIMHAEGFAHRDLKPQNVFVVQRHPQWWVKLGDFGLSKKRTDGTAYRTQAGTQEYMAPEIFYYVQELDTETSEYTNAIDMWSLGCIVHRVVTGKVPFLTMLSLRNYCNDQSRVPLNMPPMEEATKFVQALLTPHPAKRPVASAALESPWLTRRNRPNIIMNDPETSFAALKVLQSQDNYNTASHKGLQSNYTMPAGNDPIPDRVKNEPASEPLPSINEPISKVPKAEVQLESQEDVEDHSTVIADGISTFPLPFVKIGDIYTSKPVPNAQDALSGAVIPPVEELNKKGAGHTSEIPATQASPATDPGSAETKPLTMRNKLIVGTLNGKRVVGDSHSEAPVIPKPKPTAINNDNALPLHRHRLENLVDTLLDDEHDDEINIAGKAQPEDKDISSKRVTSLNKNRAGERVAAVQFKISPSPSLDPRSFTTARNLRLILNSYGVAYSPDATKTQLQEVLTALIRSPSSVKRRQLDQLPPGWTKCLSHDGRVYYRDGIEHVSTWTDPRTVDIEDFPQTLTGSQMSPLRLKPQESEVAQPSSHTELTLLEVQNINLFSTLIDRLQHFPAGTILHEPRIQLLYDSMGSLLPRLLRNCHEIIKKHDILVNLHAKVSRILRLRHQLSFITAKDQVQFEKLFSSAVGNEQTLSGDKAMEILWRSGLNGDVLSQIWTLADTARAGKLHFPEFALAMYLCNMKLLGKSLPSSLPRNIAIEVWSITDIINGGVANGPFLTALATNTSEINTRKFLAPRPHDLVAPSASNFHWLDSPLEEDPEMRPTLLEQQPQPETVVNLSGSADLLWPSSGIQPLSTSQYEPYEDPQYHRPIYIPPTYKSRQHITDKPQEEPKKSKKGLFSRLLGRQSSELSGNVYRATESIHISVQTLTGIATQVEVGQTETIGDLKDMLHDLKGIPSDQQIITYAGKQLQDYCTIESYHIPDDAILHLVQRQKPKDVTEERRDLIIVNVKAISGKTTFINISAAESVWTLKCMIQDKEGIPTNQQVLIFGGKQLDDQASLLSGYGILDRSIVYLIEKLHPASTSDLIEVYIKTLAGQTWILNTRQNETISSLKAQIQERQGIPQYRQRLFFMGKVLENNGTLKDYDIQDRSTVYMTLWIESARETIEIDISTRSGKQIKLMASPIETIKSIKGKIRDKEGIPLDLQILIFVGQELEDDRTVEETKIRNGSTIRLVQRLRG